MTSDLEPPVVATASQRAGTSSIGPVTLQDETMVQEGHAEELILRAHEEGLDVDRTAAARPADDWLTDVRRSYLDQGAIGYLIYMVGAVTAFLAAALALSDGQAGLHSSALAVGMITASLLSHGLDRRFGVRLSHFAALALCLAGALLLAWAPAFPVSLLGAAGIGLGCGLLLGHVNSAVSVSGGVLALIRLTRSTLVSMLLSVTVPVVIGIGVAMGTGWSFVVVPVFLLVGIAAWATRSRPDSPHGNVTARRLPREYWLPWVLTVLVVGVEFGILFWASSIVERSTGVSLADATLTISVYIGGIIVGRTALSTHVIGRNDPVWLLRGGLLLTFVGSLLVWLVPSFGLAALAMFLLGLGLGWLYPIAGSITLATAPHLPTLAAARLVLASGVAMLSAPFMLGIVADVTGVTTAWLLLPAICVAAALMTVPVARARARV
jgi:fucose permease